MENNLVEHTIRIMDKKFKELMLNQTYDLDLFLNLYCTALAYNGVVDPDLNNKILLIRKYEWDSIRKALKKYGKTPGEGGKIKWEKNVKAFIHRKRMVLFPKIKTMIAECYPQIHKILAQQKKVKTEEHTEMLGSYDNSEIVGTLETPLRDYY